MAHRPRWFRAKIAITAAFAALVLAYAVSFFRPTLHGPWGWNGSEFWLKDGQLLYTWDIPFPVHSTPFWPVLIVAAALTALVWKLHPGFPPGCCRGCGYNLTGLPTPFCPECGTPSRQPAPPTAALKP